MSPVPTSLPRRALSALKLAGSAIRLARSDDARVAENARAYLAASMGELRGLPQKIGQILSMGEDAAAEAFRPLTGEAQPLPFAVVEQALTTEWRRPWREVLAEIEPEGHAASLGQVHRARLHTGEEVAVKVQYPGIAKAVEADLKLLGWLSLPVGGLSRGFDISAYRDEILRDLTEELDYVREAAHQHRFALLARYLPGVTVPHVFGEHSTARVLVTAWEAGEPLERVAREWPAAQRKAAARRFLGTMLECLLLHGFVQGDLHPGNFRFRQGANGEPELVLYDFGCMFQPPSEVRLALLRLIGITEAHGADDPYPLFLALGFDPRYLEPIADKLPALSRILLEPFLRVGEFDAGAWPLGDRVSQVLGEDRWNFRIAGPAALILLMRVFHGLLHTLRALGEPVAWKPLLRPIAEELAPLAAALPLPVPERPERSFSRMARHLCIQVSENGRTRVRLTSPLHVVDHLEESMDEETLAKVRARRIDLDALVARVRASGYRPQEVFQLDLDPKRIRVWLE